MCRAARHDLIIIGGGVYGLALALEATRRGLGPLLLEKGSCGGATSAASLRILHGGLRHLQTLDLARALESIRERAWWRRSFPELVHPLPCLMPLYGEGLKRPGLLRLALALNQFLARHAGDAVLPPGRIVGAEEVRAIFPQVERRGLQGGALWHDAIAPDMAALLGALRQRAEAGGATVREGVEARGVVLEAGRIAAVRARDLQSGEEMALRAPLVVNAAGPWAAAVATACGAPAPELAPLLLAWNVIFDRPPPFDHALAVSARTAGAPMWFLVPMDGRLVAGTGYAPWPGVPSQPQLPAADLQRFVAALAAAAPGLGLQLDQVSGVLAGLLPATRAGGDRFATRPRIIDHGARGGPPGLLSVSGVKLTTARAVAARLLRRLPVA
jgi:glycerol-3-phosphate dehydrogenase